MVFGAMDSLKEWPEPIVRVQSLSDSGITTIPDRYVRHPSERPSGTNIDDVTHKMSSIPVIDLAGLAKGAAEFRVTMKAISAACREWGFFHVVNHGVSTELMEKTREVWRGFFHLPMEVKQTYANSPMTYEGYGSRLGIEKGANLDWVDYYFLNLLPHAKDNEKWPAQPSSCRDTTEEYCHELVRLCGMLMKVMSLSLGLDFDVLQKIFGGDDIGTCMRANFYPKCPQPDLTLGLSAHSDPGGLTILLADDCVTGLQVLKGHTWVTVQPVPDSFVVNVGDQIQIEVMMERIGINLTLHSILSEIPSHEVLSNAVYKSVEHRVIVNGTEERISLAFFYNPKSDVPLAPVQELVTPERPPLYQPMTFNDYRLYIRNKGPQGKMQMESLKASAV